tara:strand:+ start:21 stop:704 length:684 start_codon:yes stop_codon:yes gene_type:complete
MAQSLKYFRQLSNFQYISQDPEDQGLMDAYTTVKNLFRRVKIREDIFSNLMYFTNYKIVGDERPDQVAEKVYDDVDLDWVVLVANNILNIREEWPFPQKIFDEYLLEKYGTYDNVYAVKHYKSREVRDSVGTLILPKDLIVDENYSVTFFDIGLGTEVTKTNLTDPVTNFQYENEKEDAKRNIYLLKPEYLSIILDDLKSLMQYKKGSSQFLTRTLLKADNPNFFTT